ncbi:nitrogen regulatory protein P-II [Desulfonatronospira thiodismutans ASO3-1]|uniref:Nitrogen regulatory protein P-II n=1 Tax=Desulfonatronospira thiodismutans ASO3-1 TaxID=555779 RepID=D6SPC7_9BACT|nr:MULTISPECIES: P-II family nitrogen regulator [Desulfonatronospira]EFI34603.1 nitrogen regulatory protein P-II [Desulfonatronospira thiodismutans ASO3-1]
MDNFDLIVTIVNKNTSEPLIKASKKAGAEGGTIIYGRGTGIRETKTLLGIPIQPEKEIILTIVSQDISEKVHQAIMDAGHLDKPGAGISFVVELKKVSGICHLCTLDQAPDKQED